MIGFEDTEINCAGHQAPSHASCGGLEGKCSCWPNNWVLMMIPRCCITATRRDARTWWLREDGMVACVKGEIFLYKLGNIFLTVVPHLCWRRRWRWWWRGPAAGSRWARAWVSSCCGRAASQHHVQPSPAWRLPWRHPPLPWRLTWLPAFGHACVPLISFWLNFRSHTWNDKW